MSRMISLKTFLPIIISAAALISITCSSKKDPVPVLINYTQDDHMGRPAVKIIFLDAADSIFGKTIPSQQKVTFNDKFRTKLLQLNPGFTTNFLGQDATTFSALWATDVLNISLIETPTFQGSKLIFTGRALTDDVIKTELTLIYGGPSGTANPTLIDDHVPANDHAFLGTFPYVATSN